MKARGWLFACAVSTATIAGCGGGSGAAPPPPAPPPAPTPAPAPAPAPVLPPLLADTPVRISAATPFNATCTGTTAGTLYLNSEVEPYVAINPRDANNWIAVWQQDRWSSGSANGVLAGTTLDGGVTWTRSSVPFSRCAGGTPANNGDYERATDPWVTFAPDGTAYQMALSTSGASFTASSISAMLVSRSSDGGLTWGPISTLIRDTGGQFFNDKNSITADPTDANYVYAVWDRLSANGGPSILVRSADGGATWDAPRVPYDPGANSQTINNIVVVLPNGTVVLFFTRLDTNQANVTTASMHVALSADKGISWTGPIKVADALAVGARVPETGALIRDGASLGSIAVAPNGHLWVAWQDARFSGGVRDGIALSRSTDGGLTWSAPVQLNSAPAVQAFTPTVHVLANGTIGVTYYDLRSNTADASTLPTELILARSSDAVTWTEHRISPAFDLLTAPVANGYFVGDYQGLTSANNVFVPVYVRTNSGDLANRTDVFALAARSLPALSASSNARALRTAPAGSGQPDSTFRQRVDENIVAMMERRVSGWSARFARPPER